jgi:hypothetical protein
MTEQNPDPDGTPPIVDPAGNPLPTPDPAPDPAPAAGDPGAADVLDGMTAEQVAQIEAALTERAKNRPKPIADQLAEMRSKLETLSDDKQTAVEQRKQGRDTADELGAAIAEVSATMRRIELSEAVKAANFAAPDQVTDLLMKQAGPDTSVAALVAQAAASGAFAMAGKPPTASLGTTPKVPTRDPGRTALEQEIADAYR